MTASASAAPSGVVSVRTTATLDFGRIWSSIFSVMVDSPPKSILFVSPGAGQGASTLAAGVALTAAQANPQLRLGLLDGNFRSPSLERLFQIPGSPGVIDALSGTTAPEELGYALGIHSNLFVIPAGTVADDPLALLRREKMVSLITNLSSRFDMLLIDSAPVNQYPDAQLIAGIVDAAVLVVDVSRAPREAIAKAKQVIHISQGHLVGTVLNRRSHPVPGILYGRA